MAGNGKGGKGWLFGLLLLGGVGVAAYLIIKRYQAAKALESGVSAQPQVTVDVNDPNARKPHAVRTNVPGRFV